ELVAGWAQSVIGELAEDDRYGDAGLPRQTNPGEITPQAIADLHAMVAEKLQDRDAFARWFGQYATAPKNPEIDWQPEQPVESEEVGHRLAQGVPLLRNPATRFSYICQGPNALTLFVDGEAFECSAAAAGFAKRLCVQDRLSVDAVLAGSEDVFELILELLDMGSVAFDED
ncbi:MAG TPA: winged helix domain-containing protein, partial [Erythrobacter sp.]|nr:winged helix domain-containing protein [Erythrobacter sp.]